MYTYICMSLSIYVCVHIHKYAHIYVYVCLYNHHQVKIFLTLSLSLSPFVPIIHRSYQVLQTTSCVRAELLSVSSCWSANTDMTI